MATSIAASDNKSSELINWFAKNYPEYNLAVREVPFGQGGRIVSLDVKNNIASEVWIAEGADPIPAIRAAVKKLGGN